MKVNGFVFRRWVERFKPGIVVPFIALEVTGRHRIDRFTTSSYFYLWSEDKNQYMEIDTDSDIARKENIDRLVQTFDELIASGAL